MTTPAISGSPTIKDLIKKEYIKCATDEAYFLSRYCYIQEPIKGKILFNLFQYQKNTLKDFAAHDYNIILKGRQIGISTLVAGHALHMMLFGGVNKNILVIATKKDTAKNLVTKVQYMHSNLPVWLRGECVEDNKLSMKFANGSQIKAVARSKDAGRSEALSLLILDEAAFIEGATEIWAAASSTLSTGGKAILLSTPNGMGNFFHTMWQESEEKTNSFNPILLDWRVHPNRDQAWRDKQTELLGEMMASQEHDASFIFSGNTVISPDLIQFYKKTHMQEPIERQGFDANLHIWEYPQDGKSYILSGDVARGDGSDFSTFHVIDAESSAQVAEYRGKIPPKEFGNLMVNVATQYNDALLIADNSTIGWGSLQQVIDRGYKNLFYMSADLQYVDVEHQITNRNLIAEKNLKPGFTISTRTRPLIIAKLEEYMRDNSVTIHSIRTLNEMDTFIWKNGKPEALVGKNDDLIMALCIGLWVRDTALRLRSEGIELSKRALEYASYSAAPFVSRGPDNDSYTFKVSDTETEDLKWLIS